jgi:hypothetical protein
MEIVLRKLGYSFGHVAGVNRKPFIQKDFCLRRRATVCFRNEIRASTLSLAMLAAQSVAPL